MSPEHALRGLSWRWLQIPVIAVVLAAAAWAYAHRTGWRVTAFAADADDLRAQLIRYSSLPILHAGHVRRLRAEGTQPDGAVQQLTIQAPAAAVRAGFLTACRKTGLLPAGRDTLASEPDALCAGPWQGGSVTVELVLDCAQSCRAELGIYHLWF